MRKISLNGTWSGFGYSPDGKEMQFSATVPGCVHTDLLKAGVIEDPLYRDKANDCQWIESWSWSFEREFDINTLDNDAYLLFEGLDVYCDIYLNGIRIASTENMFHPHRVLIKDAAKLGTNKLRLNFISPTALTVSRPKRDCCFTAERLYIRRMQCTFFWDWVNRFITAGIYKDVYLVYPEKVAVDSIYAYTNNIDQYSAQIGLQFNFEVRGSGAYAHYCIIDPCGKVVYNKKRLIVEETIAEFVDIVDPQLWYPSGYGEQPLYDVVLKVYENDSFTHIIDEKSIKIGIRTIKLMQLPDEKGTEYYEKCKKISKGHHVTSDEGKIFERNNEEDYSGFIVVVNGVKIMCKGANWVPIEPFPSEVKEEKIDCILDLCKKTNMNMIRVWGGGLFEIDHFYEECDRLGFLVTQDFLMACGTYPDDDPAFLEQLRNEAIFAAKKLRSHACLAWWSGDNENAMQSDEDMPNYPGRAAALRANAPVLRMYDPHRYFLPSSPCFGKSYGSITKGTSHNTNFVGQVYDHIRTTDMSDYREYYGIMYNRFNVEEPAFGAPMLTSARKFMTDEDIFGEDLYMWRYHAKGSDPKDDYRTVYDNHDVLNDFGRKVMGEYKSGLDRLFKYQYSQYEMVRSTMERFRKNKWFSGGTLFWMLSDAWPASGWSFVDYYGFCKPGYFSFKRCAKDVICCADKDDDKNIYNIYVCNDSLSAVSGKLRVYVWDLAKGAPSYDKTFDFNVEENTTSIVQKIDAAELSKFLGTQNVLLCEIEGENICDRAFYIEKRFADVNLPETSAQIIERGDDYIKIRANDFAMAVSVEGEYDFDDNFFLMLPGEEKTVHFSKARIHTSDDIWLCWFGKTE